MKNSKVTPSTAAMNLNKVVLASKNRSHRANNGAIKKGTIELPIEDESKTSGVKNQSHTARNYQGSTIGALKTQLINDYHKQSD